MNCADRVAGIVFTGQQGFSFRLYDLMFKTGEQFPHFTQERVVFFSKFKEYLGVGNFSFERFLPLDGMLQTAASLQQLLRGLLIRPEVRRGSLRLNLL